MKIDQLMLCLAPQCREVSPIATHCPICASQDLAELRDHAGKIEALEREQRRIELFAEFDHMVARVKSADLGPEDDNLGVCI